MIFYHGGASEPCLEKCREACPALHHANEWTPGKLLDRKNFIYDNGAFTGDFEPSEWVKGLFKIQGFENEPDFIVLPDVFNDPEATFRRSRKWADVVKEFGYDYYYVAQKPGDPEEEVQKAIEVDASGVFIGGSDDWKKRNAEEIVEEAHRRGLKAHIGMPGDYFWAYKTGADSMDSVSVARDEKYERLRDLQANINSQYTFEVVSRDED